MNEREYKVVVIGAAGLDLHVWPRTMAVEPGKSNPGHIRWSWGGVGRNIAENLAHLGAEVFFISAVGDDEPGHNLLRHLQEVGINTDGVYVAPDQHTGAYVAQYHFDRRLAVAFDDMLIMRSITPAYLQRYRSLIRRADMVCIDANLTAEALEALFRITSKHGVPVCADPTAELLAPRLHPFLPELTAVTPNRREAEMLVGEPLPDDEALIRGARRLVHLGVELAVITLGEGGLCYATPEESGRLPALKIEVVDAVGAGDALTAAIAYALLEEIPPSEAVRLGQAAAARTIACKETICSTLSWESLYESLTG